MLNSKLFTLTVALAAVTFLTTIASGQDREAEMLRQRFEELQEKRQAVEHEFKINQRNLERQEAELRVAQEEIEQRLRRREGHRAHEHEDRRNREEVHERLQHMRAAHKHAMAAGMTEIAEQIAQRTKRLNERLHAEHAQHAEHHQHREMHRQPERHREDARQDGDREFRQEVIGAIRELGAGLKQLRAAMNELKEDVEELEEEIEEEDDDDDDDDDDD